ncbi:hypothetical protein L3Q82_024867, partial [Scortum barcoo]
DIRMGGCQITSRCSNRNKTSALMLDNCEHACKSNVFIPCRYQKSDVNTRLDCSKRRRSTCNALKGITGLGISEKMGSSSLLFIALTVSLSSLIQTSHSLDNSDSVRMTRSARRNNASDGLAGELIFQSESDSVEGSGHSGGSTTSHKPISRPVSDENSSGSGITLTTKPALTLHHSGAHEQEAYKANTSITGYTHSSAHIILEEALSRIRTETKESHTSIVNDGFLDGSHSPKLPVQNNVFTSMTNQSKSGIEGPCVLGLSPCVVLPNFNGTSLLWDDMRRTLAFAWDLHVFGSASLFILIAVLAVMGMGGACTLPPPVCDAVTLANSLLILTGTLRGVLLLLDPYGTCQILSRATLAATP